MNALKNASLTIVAGLALVSSVFAEAPSNEIKEPEKAKALILEMIEASGGVDKFYALKDVEYTYTYRDNGSGKSDISTERYIFDGELSWASYKVHEKFVLPGKKGEVVQAFDGKTTWTTLDGKDVTDLQAVKLADFLRKTNYYWFAMMFKLADPGIIYSYEGQREVNGIQYDIVKIGYEAGIGDVQDFYVCYINPETKLIDQFLFTVMDFGKKDPYLMEVKYETVDGLKLPVNRRYAPANWDGKILKDVWVDEISENIKFNNGFDRSMFSK